MHGCTHKWVNLGVFLDADLAPLSILFFCIKGWIMSAFAAGLEKKKVFEEKAIYNLSIS